MKKLYFLLFLSLSLILNAQTPGDIAQSFGSAPGFNSIVRPITVQSDGKIIVGGNFNTYNGVTENRIIRLNADGTTDTSFNTGAGINNEVYAIVVQPDGKILVGGSFTAYNGVTENRIIRLNADGTKDTFFNTGTGFNTTVVSIALQPDGKILMGGSFTSYNGTAENRIIRLNANGTKDTSFNSSTGFNSIVWAIAVQPDGKILLGGEFTTYNGITENRILRLNTDGTKDASFNTGTGINNAVYEISVQLDGKILVGGLFTMYNGVTENRILRLNADGTKDTSFNTGTGFNNWVYKIAVQTDGKILLGGNFTTYQGLTQNYITRLNGDGTKDTSFNSGTGFNSIVWAITVQPDGKILVGGSFNTYKGVTENFITRLNNDVTKDTSFNTGTGFNSNVRAITMQPDGKILVGGLFSSYKGATENRILRLNADGTKDTSFNTGTGFNNLIYTIAVQPDSKILAGGNFTSYNEVTGNFIVRLNADGTTDTSFNTGTGFNDPVLAIAVQPDGKILVGGSFTTYNGVTENYIIRLNTDGTKDTSFNTGTGLNNGVRTIRIRTDGKILVGGDFTNYNGAPENRILLLNTNGTKDTSFSTGTGWDSNVLVIGLQPDGKLLIGGQFSTYNGVTENRILRLNADGTKDTSFNTGNGFNGPVYDLAVQVDGKIFVGGEFTTYKGITENRFIRLNTDGTKDTSFNTGTGFNSTVFEIAVQPNGKILVGGSFTNYKDSAASAYLIALHSEASLGTEDFMNSNGLVIFPNPVNDVLNVKANDINNIQGVKIIDLQGKMILENRKNSINVSNLAKGLYIVKITTDQGEITKKFIKD